MAEISDIQLEKAIDEVFKLYQDTGSISAHDEFFGAIKYELQQKGFETSTIEKKLDNYINKNIDHSFFQNEFNIYDIPDVRKNISPIFSGREGLPITPEQDKMLEIRWAENWSTNGEGWGQQVHGTYTSEVVDGFYQFKADNPDIPNWWFPRDFMDGQQLTQRAFVGWGVTQEDIDNLKEGFEKGIFDKEKNKKLLKVVNDLDGSSMLINVDTPTNVVDFREKQLEKLMKEVEDATPNVTKITSSQAEMIDNALADAAANLRRGTFEALPGGKGALTKAIKTRLVSLLGDGLNVLDVYELGLLLGAVGQPAIEPIVKLIFPDVPDDNRPYKEKVLENIQRVEKISPTAKAVKKISEAMPEPDDTEYTIYGVPSNRAVQFTSMYGMLGGNNGEK